MYLMRKWDEIMGPKDERLEAQECRSARASASILLVGAVISLYYAIMLNQVALTTDHPILTDLGETLVPVQALLMLTILVAGFVGIGMQLKGGAFSSYKRFAEVDCIPWDYVALFAVFCGVMVGLLTSITRIVAEAQIVGIANIAWAGDLAMGVVFFGIGFAVGFVAIACTIRDAIKRRRALERELEE